MVGSGLTVTTISSVAVQLLAYWAGASVLHVAPLMVPLFPLLVKSLTVLPEPSLKFQ